MQSSNAYAGMAVTPSGTVILVNCVQPLKILPPFNEVTVVHDNGKLTELSFVQPEKAYAPIVVMLSGSTMLSSAVHFWNAYSPSVFKLFGSVMAVRLVQPLNAELPRLVTPAGTFTLFSATQPEKASEPIDVSVEGRMTVFR